jgi:uncharacterized protein involved in high-affinity Fe2+ transport
MRNENSTFPTDFFFITFHHLKNIHLAGCGGSYEPVISATQETEIGRIRVRGQYMQKVSKTPSQQQQKPEHGDTHLSSWLHGKHK